MIKCIVFFLLITPFYLVAQVLQGPNNPASSSNVACTFSYGSTIPYAPSNAIYTSDNVYASALHCACCDQNTNCLFATNFGFSIPGGATITGIIVEIEKGTNSSNLQDNGLRLLKNNLEVGSDYAQFSIPWQLSDTYVTYGGCTDLWGTTWTPSDINSPNFGLAFASIDYSCSGLVSSRIDHIRITICYTIILPISVDYFFGTRENDTIKLEWKIKSDETLSSIDVEHSEDGVNFEVVKTIFSDMRSTPKNHLSFNHYNIKQNTSYYRLKTYKNNKVDYSNSISIPAYEKTKSILFPNPSTGIFTIKTSIGSPYFLCNPLGEILLKEIAKDKEFKIDLSAYPNGMYVLKINDSYHKLLIER